MGRGSSPLAPKGGIMRIMLRRLILPIPIGYAIWILWACVLTLRDASAAAANPKYLAFAIVRRECDNIDFVPPSCLKLLRDTVASIGEPTIATALWLMRGFYAEFILVPPMWFVAMAGIGAGVWCLCLIGWYLVLRRRKRGLRSSSRVRQEWMAARALSWPFNNSATHVAQGDKS
jgi:hypothetical protein